MRGAALLLLLLAGIARADAVDEVLAALRRGDPKGARVLADEALRGGALDAARKERLTRLRAVAERLEESRRIQRTRGYDAAVEFLEPRVDHWILAQAYGEAARWAGQEERGLRGLRRSGLPLAERIQPELYLLSMMQRYEEIVQRAKQARKNLDWAELDHWIDYAGEEAGLRRRLQEREKRAAWLALGALVVVLAAWTLLWRAAGSRPLRPPA